MNTIAKILIAIPVAVGVIVVGAVGALEAASSWNNYRFERSTPLAARLPHDVRQASNEFQRRIRMRFPIGTRQEELVSVLAGQGFQPIPNNPNYMRVTIMGGLTTGLCRKDWDVTWRTNKDSLLTAIDADYRFTCP